MSTTNLQTRFVKNFIAVFVCVFAVLLVLSYLNVRKDAELRALETCNKLVSKVEASRAYVRNILRPKMFEVLPKGEFIHEAMSASFVARSQFEIFLKEYPEYYVKFASLNPRNPVNQADEVEQQIIREFQMNSELKRWEGKIHRNGKQYLSVAKPFRFKKGCMRCHGNPADAPKSLLARYGDKNGFGVKLGDVTMYSVAVPISVTNDDILHSILSVFVPMFFLGIIMILIATRLFRRLVMLPMAELKVGVNAVAEGNYDFKLDTEESGEMKELAFAFNSMASSVNEHISHRKEMEQALMSSEKRYREVVEGTTDLITRVDAEGKFIFVNKLSERIFGIEAEKCIGLFASDFIHPDDRQKSKAWLNECIQEHREQSSIENRLINNKTGAVYQMVWTSSFIYDEEGHLTRVNGIAHDITEHIKAEEERQKVHKLESIGILAGGIAHDFNNIMTVILGKIFTAKRKVDIEGKVYKDLEVAEQAVDRATHLTRQLLTFSRGGAPITKRASLIEIIQESTEFALKGSNVKCEYNAPDELWSVEVDEGQIYQVIHNLVLNADHAMPEGGTIRIRTENFDLGSDTELPLPEGKYVKVVIQDQGIGIDSGHLQKIFDPYFTTKEMGRGLGLSISYSIVKQHGGHISAESELGAGTTFTIYMPVSDKQGEETDATETAFVVGEGKILLMDDEEIVRESIGEYLTLAGYEVEYAKDGKEAIDLYKKSMKTSEPFHAVILDLTIRGGMGGQETVKKLLEINPDVKAIVSSGYSNSPVMANCKEYGFSDVFCKALNSPEDLCRILNKVLAKSRP